MSRHDSQQQNVSTGVRGFIEITPDLDASLLGELVGAAYLLSRGGRVVLLLPNSPVDDTVLQQAREAEFVIAESEGLSQTLLSHGIRHLRTREGVRYLRSIVSLDDRREDGSSSRFPIWW